MFTKITNINVYPDIFSRLYVFTQPYAYLFCMKSIITGVCVCARARARI